MRSKQVMYAWAGAPCCGLAPVDVGHVLQDLSTGTDLSLFSGLSPLLQSFPFSSVDPPPATTTGLKQTTVKRHHKPIRAAHD